MIACWGPCCGCSGWLMVFLGLLLPICLSSIYEQELLQKLRYMHTMEKQLLPVFQKLYTPHVQIAASQPEQSIRGGMVQLKIGYACLVSCMRDAKCSSLQHARQDAYHAYTWQAAALALCSLHAVTTYDVTVALGLAKWLAEVL